MRIRGRDAFGGLALVALVFALVLAPVLLVLTVRAPTGHVISGRFSAASCPSSTDLRCYGAVVTNAGDAPTAVRCTLVPQGGPPATFFNDTDRYESGGTLGPGTSITLLIKLEPSARSSPALPKLSCEPA
ncbi:MAG: hypothetical protein HY240_04205 [Actinobacteria bacterium]|nr:hypothetical protein [Actinomycetota bacterium]